ncbi:MAG: ribonuclease P protein component [Flavitalea sp.]
MAGSYSLGRDERLKSRKQTEQLFARGNKFTQGILRVYYQFHEPGAPLLFGAGASSKTFKKAVDRNRIKRLIREAYRLQKPGLKKELEKQKKYLTLFFIYTGKELPAYELVYEHTGKAIDKLFRIITKAN